MTHGAQNNDQNPKIGIPFVLGKVAQKAAQRCMSPSLPPMRRGAEMENIRIVHLYQAPSNRLMIINQ